MEQWHETIKVARSRCLMALYAEDAVLEPRYPGNPEGQTKAS